jgi:hypothetical protein
MNRRSLLGLLGSLPLLGWVRGKQTEPVIACDMAAGPSEAVWGLSDNCGIIELPSRIVSLERHGEYVIVGCLDGFYCIGPDRVARKIAHRLHFASEPPPCLRT